MATLISRRAGAARTRLADCRPPHPPARITDEFLDTTAFAASENHAHHTRRVSTALAPALPAMQEHPSPAITGR